MNMEKSWQKPLQVAAGVQVKIHIEVDTGMSRIGFLYQVPERDAAVIDEIEDVCHMKGLYPEGIFTHFSVSDEGEPGDSLQRIN